MSITSAAANTQSDTKAALIAYLDALALAEPVQAQLWQRSRLTLAQASVLRNLRSGPHTAGKLGEMVGLSAASTSRLLDRLERRGLVSRSRDSHDRRIVEVHLEPAGERLLGEVRVFKGSDVHRAVETMSSEERRRLTTSLTRLVELTRDIVVQREARS